MSVAAPMRRLAPRCLYCNPRPILSRAQQHQQLRAASSDNSDNNDPTAPKRSNPVLEEYLRRNPSASRAQAEGALQPRPGDLASSSIFEDDRRAAQQVASTQAAEHASETTGAAARDPQNMARVLDPDPNARERWERKQVIKAIRKGGRVTRAQFVKRTEREHLLKSENMKTSTKKLGMLARQIAGKTLEEAIVQMRFSKKKVAQQVLKHLEAARDEAVVMRGMGLGNPNTPQAALEALNSHSKTTPNAIGPTETKPLSIQLKDGKRHAVSDLSTIYIDQAWVGRGPYGKLPDYRARGRVFIMHTPFTSLSVVLKEEATRVREFAEREEKRRRQRVEKVWVALPDRPVQGPRGQWYSW